MNSDIFLKHFFIFFKITSGASKTTCTKRCKLSLTSYVYFSQQARRIQIIFDCELHKLIPQTNKMAFTAKQDDALLESNYV